MFLCFDFISAMQMPRAVIVPHHFLKKPNVPTWHPRHTDKIIRPEINCAKYIYLHSSSFSAVNKCNSPSVLRKCTMLKTTCTASTRRRIINKGQCIVNFIRERLESVLVTL